jgi:hypothetical protein
MQSLQIASSEHEEQLCSLAQLSHWISCYKIWNQFQLESCLNFKGVQTFVLPYNEIEEKRKIYNIVVIHFNF